MYPTLTHINSTFYQKKSLQLFNFIGEPESQEYEACQFVLNDSYIICRTAKITPKKIGQFVTFWKRDVNRITKPYSQDDQFDFYVVIVKKENRLGQFVFPKSILVSKGIISTLKNDGKRGFRVYPLWDVAVNKQAKKTQEWQLNFFVELNEDTDFIHMNNLYRINS